MSITLAALKTRVLQRADMVSSSFVTGDELRGFINASGAELHAQLVVKYEDYFTDPNPTTFSITGSASVYQLPDDVLKLRGVDVSSGGAWLPLNTWALEERGRYLSSAFNGTYLNPTVRYRRMGRSIAFVPEGNCAGDYRFRYVPRWTDLVSDSDTIPEQMAVEGWDELIVVDGAIKCRDKEESDVSVLAQQKQMLMTRVTAESTNRDASESECVVDVRDRDRWT